MRRASTDAAKPMSTVAYSIYYICVGVPKVQRARWTSEEFARQNRGSNEKSGRMQGEKAPDSADSSEMSAFVYAALQRCFRTDAKTSAFAFE